MGSGNSVQGRGGDGGHRAVESEVQGADASRIRCRSMGESQGDTGEASEWRVPSPHLNLVTPLLRSHGIGMPRHLEYADNYGEKGIPTLLKWSHGGIFVAVAGSWDDWETKNLLHQSGKDFAIIKVLLPGVYQYRFIVDGEWRHAPDYPWMHDEMGNALNVLDLQDYIPDNLESLASFEIPQSPDSSYGDGLSFPEDYTKEPPLVPLQLDTQPYIENDLSTFSKPRHVVLDHLHIQKPTFGQQVVAVGETCRFRSKYVTAVLFKSLPLQ